MRESSSIQQTNTLKTCLIDDRQAQKAREKSLAFLCAANDVVRAVMAGLAKLL